jgi:hypothetical protein
MAFNVKYYYNFKSLNNNDTYKVEILEDAATTPEEIRGAKDPFIVDFPEKDLFDPVKSSGAILNLFSQTDRQFLDLYTSDYLKYKVRLYKNTTELIWSGYLDTELYTEQFNSIDNYPVQLTANDGFVLADRIYFYDSSGYKKKYSGLISQWSLIQIILDKLDLDHSYLQVGLSTTSTGVTITTSTTILHGVYVQASNFYDEDDKPQTLRTILNDLLLQYGATMKRIGDTIYIYDNNTLLSNGNFKKYNSSFTYLSQGSITTLIGDLSSIGFASTNQQLTIQPAINTQKIKLSKYSTNEIVNYTAGNDFQYLNNIGSFGIDSDEYKWAEFYFQSSSVINNGSAAKLTLMKGMGTENLNNSAFYIKWDPDYDYYQNLISFKYNPFMYASTNSNIVYYLKIAVKAYIRTKSYEGDPSENPYSYMLKAILSLNVKCGSYMYYMDSQYAGTWLATSDPTYTTNLVYFYDVDRTESIGDQWILNKSPKKQNPNEYHDFVLIPLSQNLADEIEISVINSTQFYGYNEVPTNPNAIHDVRISDIVVSISDAYGNDIKDTDLEIIGSLDPLAKNEGEEITLLSGVNENYYPICRSGLFNASNQGIVNFTRNSQTTRLESLLLNSIQSNKELPRVKLIADLNTPDHKLGYFTYDNYLSGKKLVPIATKYNYSDESVNVTLLEVVTDNLTII